MDMDVVCKDILSEILVRLPDCKTAIRVSTVCKRWSRVINSPNFKQRFNDHKKKNKECMQFTHVFRMAGYCELLLKPMYELSIGGGGEKEKCLEFLPWWKDMIVLASSGGLLVTRVDNGDLCICNPMTKQWNLIPRGDIRRNDNWFGIIGLACNPDNTHFKVVHITSILGDQLSTREFCSESGAWVRSSLPLPGSSEEVKAFRVECTQVGTTLYWLMGTWRAKVLLAHDPFERSACFLKLPLGGGGDRGVVHCRVRMGSVLGRLRISQILWKKEIRVYYLRVWELRDDKSCWRLVHRVKPTSFPTRKALVVCFHPNDGDKLFVSTDRSDVCLYDIKGDTFRKLGQFPPYNPYHIKQRLQNFSLLHPSSMPCLIPKFVNHCKREAGDALQIKSKKTKR